MNVKVEANTITAVAKSTEVVLIVERVNLGSSCVSNYVVSLSFAPVISIGGHSISAITPENNFYEELAVSI